MCAATKQNQISRQAFEGLSEDLRRAGERLDDAIRAVAQARAESGVVGQSAVELAEAARQESIADKKHTDLTAKLMDVSIVEPQVWFGEVKVGSFVTIRNEEGTEFRYHIAGKYVPSATKLGEFTMISTKSPTGQALMGRRVGDECNVGPIGKTWVATIVKIEGEPTR